MERFKRLVLALLIFAFFVPVLPGGLWAQDSGSGKISEVMALRFNLGGYEAEVFLGSIGILYVYYPEYDAALSLYCQYTVKRQDAAVRKFFTPGGDGWYFGISYAMVENTGTEFCSVTEKEEIYEGGAIPTFGYYWKWESGMNVDLGLRSGLLAVGFHF